MRRLAVLGIALAALALAPAAAALVPGGNGRIAFVGPSGPRFQDFHVYSMNQDGTGTVDLTPGFGDEAVGLDWSPDGTQIAFTSYEEPFGMAIWVMDADGSDRHKILTIDSFDASLSWTPDGSRLVYAAAPSEDSTDYGVSIDSVKPDGTDVQRILLFPNDLTDPMVSPDGTRIAFTGAIGRSERPRLFVANMDGTGLHRITSFPSYQSAWSPDGSKLVTVSERGVETVTTDGTGRTLLLESDPFDAYFGLTWSPDGRRIAFTSGRWDFKQAVRTINADGTCPTRLTSRYSERMAWQSIPGGLPSGPIECANLHVRSRASAEYVRTGQTYTVLDTIRNDGTVEAENSLLRHRLDAGTSAVSAIPSQGSCTLGRAVRCRLGTLAAGASATVELTIRTTRGTPISSRRRQIKTQTTTTDPEPGQRTIPHVWACDFLGTDADDVVHGTAGNDTLCGLGGHDRFDAGPGKDVLVGGRGRDSIRGGQGLDWIESGAGDDVVHGGDDFDFIFTGAGNDVLFGEGDRDLLIGGFGRDRMFGGAGWDVLDPFDGEKDLADGGTGRDTAFADSLDRLVSIEVNGWDTLRPASLRERRGAFDRFSRFLRPRLRYDFSYSRWKGSR